MTVDAGENRPSRGLLLVAAPVFFAALFVYGRTLAPSITWAHRSADGGDLIAAAATLGVAHPPGYPTYVILGHAFGSLPLGDAAFRLNLMSAVCAALACALTAGGIARTVKRLTASRATAAIAGGLALAAAPMVWSQAVVAEVHALNLLFVAALMYLLAPGLFRAEPPAAPGMTLAAFLWGVGLGNSPTLAALAPLTLAAWWRAGRAPWAVASFALGLCVYAFIPIRAAAHPPVNWGDATNLPNFVAQVSAALYRPYVFGLPLSEYPARIVAFARLVVTQFGWPGVLLGAWGVARGLGIASAWRPLAASSGLYVLFALGYDTLDSDLYLIPVWLFGAWAVAGGSLALIDWAGTQLRGWRAFGVSVIVIALVPGWNLVGHFASLDASADRRASEFGRRVLALAPEGGILVTGSDTHTFTLWYYRLVESRRTDLSIVDARLAGYAWYRRMLLDQGGAAYLPPDDSSSWLAGLAAANPGRPVCRIDPLSQEVVLSCLPP